MIPYVPVVVARAALPVAEAILVKNPGLLARVGQKLVSAGAVFKSKIPTVGEMLAWAKNNKVNALLFVTAVAGYAPDVVKWIKEKTTEPGLVLGPEDEEWITSLENAMSGRAGALIDQAAELSTTLTSAEYGSDGTRVFVEIFQKVAPAMVSLFGSEKAAIEGHRLLQAFLEMSHKDVVYSFANVKY